MSSSQRAFATKRNKMLASDVRRHVVMTGSLSHHSSTVDSSIDTTSGIGTTIQSSLNSLNLFDIVDPVDVEECLSQRKSSSTLIYEQSPTSTSPRRICEFPADDIDVRIVSRDRPTIESPTIDKIGDINQATCELDAHIIDVIRTYNDDLSLVQRRYQQYSSGEAYVTQCMERPTLLQTLTQQIYENDIEDRINYRSASVVADEQKRSSYCSSDSLSTADSTCTTREETQPHNLQQSISDSLIHGVTQRISSLQLDQMNEMRRQTGRCSTLMNLLPLQPENEVIERRAIAPHPGEHTGERLLLRVMQLVLEPDFEPIFGTIALYDIRERKKISENFYFDVNTEQQLAMIGVNRCDDESKCRQASFSITYPSNDLFIVIKLEKVLQACDINEAAEPYMKEEKQNRERLLASAHDYCSRLGAYRMPLCWTAVDLSKVLSGAYSLEANETLTSLISTNKHDHSTMVTFANNTMSDTDSIVSVDRQSSATFKRIGSSTSANNRGRSGQLNSTKRNDQQSSSVTFSTLPPLTLSINTFFKQESDRLSDDDLYKLLAESRKPGSSIKRLKFVPAEFRLELSGCIDDLPMRLTPELLHINPYITTRDSLLTKEITEFPQRDVYSVNYGYRNLLYIYPKSINFTNRPGSARNITVAIQLFDSKQRSLPVIFGKSSCINQSNIAYTSVCYHNRSPQLSDEIKLQIPIDLNDGHYLLFTFYHIACKTNGRVNNDIETPIGYTWIPLYKDGRLQTGDFNLPVSLEKLPTSAFFLSPEVNLPNIKWLDGHRSLFMVQLCAVTTLHTQDDHLDDFFRTYHSLTIGKRTITEIDLKLSIANLTKARPEPLVRFLYLVIDKLLTLIVYQPTVAGVTLNVASTSFEMLGQLIKILTFLLDSFCDSHGRSSLLTTYIHYHKIALKQSPMYAISSTKTGRSTTITGSNSSRMTTTTSNPEFQQQLHSTEHVDLYNIIRVFEKSSSSKLDVTTSPSSGIIDERLSPGKVMHDELALQWVLSSGAAREMACLNSWFFFELMIKSMAEHLSISNRLYLPRKLRFNTQFTTDLISLCTMLTTEIITRSCKDVKQSQSINSSLAFFIRDTFSLMDRNYVMDLIKIYNRQISTKIINTTSNDLITTLMLIKLDFMRIICSHEHFVILNLPFGIILPSPQPPPSSSSTLPQPPSPSSSNSSHPDSHGSSSMIGCTELTSDYRSKHYLIGIILADLAAVLDTTSAVMHSKAIGVLRNLLAAHDVDGRLTDVALKSRIATLYLPVIGVVLDAASQLYDPYYSMTINGTRRGGDVMTTRPVTPPGINPNVALAIAGMMNVSPPRSPPMSSPSHHDNDQRRPTLTLVATRQLLACFCWTLKSIDRHSLRNWLRDLSPTRMQQFIDVLQLCISCFEFKSSSLSTNVVDSNSDDLKKLEDAIIGSNSLAKEFRRGAKKLISGVDSVRWRKEIIYPTKTTWRNTLNSDLISSPMINSADILIESNLSTEISLIVLDALELVVKVVTGNNIDHLLFVFRVQMHMLACDQSVFLLENLFASLRSFVNKYSDLLFEHETEQCGELCLQLLRHCASRRSIVRSHAAANLYLLMRQSFESGSNLSKIKIQITMSLSTLVSNDARFGFRLNEDYLRRSLKTMLNYADIDDAIDGQLKRSAFSEQVKDLVFNLYMILSDTVKMKAFANDFEMLIDLMYRIARGYQNNPDLRLTWLLNMADKHADRGNYAEAAQCMLHTAALAAEYISMRTNAIYLPKGAVAFASLSDNIIEESAVSDDVLSPDDDGFCESRHFTPSGLVQLVQQAAMYLEAAQMYEAMDWVYKTIIPILEHWRDYRQLACIHRSLSDALTRIDVGVEPTYDDDAADAWIPSLSTADKRCFGTFFRVGFYGSKFADLDGHEFIYKEPAITKLSEISHRMEAFYADRFGSDYVEVIKDSNQVDRSRLDPNRAYLQITYVEPYMDRWERRRRPTHFERNYKLNRFVYATPFTKESGRAHAGDLKDQYKRRTILTTAHSFPYLKTRLAVIHRESNILTPIEVAIEDVQKKTRELAVATAQQPPDAKMLQMVLQGCVGTTVNQGPMEIANVFLSNIGVDERGKPIDKLQNKLRLCFKDFSKKCADALQKNRQLIHPDQHAYQNELQRNYIDFTKRMAPIVGIAAISNNGTLLSRHHQRQLPPTTSSQCGPISAV